MKTNIFYCENCGRQKTFTDEQMSDPNFSPESECVCADTGKPRVFITEEGFDAEKDRYKATCVLIANPERKVTVYVRKVENVWLSLSGCRFNADTLIVENSHPQIRLESEPVLIGGSEL